MKKIPLRGKHGEGKFALVDDEDYDKLSKFKWHLHKTPTQLYVRRPKSLKESGSRSIRMHQQIMNPPKNMEVDHINRNGLDNRKQNLRICTHSENMANKKIPESNTSGYRGVSWHKKSGRWATIITKNGVKCWLGLYKDKKKAAITYDRKALELFGEFASLNFPMGRP